MKRLLFFVASALFGTAMAFSSDWHGEVSKLIETGQFKKAGEIMSQLPKTHSNAVTIDSFNTIMKRIRHDFSVSPQKGAEMIRQKRPSTTDIEINDWISKKYIETLTIDGQTMWMRKAVRNLWLLNPVFVVPEDKEETRLALKQYLATNMAAKVDENGCRNWNRTTISFTLTVKADAVPEGETINAWIPIPLTSARQRNFHLISSSSKATISQNSPMHTAMLSQKAEKGKPTVFNIRYSYEVAAQAFDLPTILENLKPYDISSEEYKKYTSSSHPHINIDNKISLLARKIVDSETNPVLQARKIYRWIGKNLPWAGARDYSTIPDIPKYVLEQQHGDCGQVTLLYITLCRSLGIPARWESGWMTHPHEHNYHDWCETYYEGIGWVPTDVSFGRNNDPILRDYYFTGTDNFRLAANSDIARQFDPAKTFIRTETVDSQAGEVEWRKGNLEITNWESHLEVIKTTPIKY